MTRPEEPIFTAARCGLRLRRLQALCKKLELDALLLVPGLDGKNNIGSNQAVAYLLEGRCGRDVLDTSRLSGASEEVVMFVGPTSVGMYASPTAYRAFWPLIGPSWSNLDLRCSTKEEAEDPDRLDHCKIGTFVQLLKGRKKVGVALTPGQGGEPGSVMEVEQWALIQAYGLEGVGRPGFFTMNYEVVDVFPELQKVYAEMDSHDLDHLLHSNVPLMAQHWGEVVQTVSICKPRDRAKLSERQVGEPLLSYYAYGTLRPTSGVKQVLTMMPRVVFGTRTASDNEQASTLTLAAATAAGDPCLHFVVEAADPRSPLRAARTYFFTCGALATNPLTERSDEFFGSERDAKVLREWSDGGAPRMMRLYTALAKAARSAILHYSCAQGATPQSARQAAVDALIQASQENGVPLTPEDVGAQMRFALWGADHTNTVSAAPPPGSPMAKVLRLSLHDVTDGSGKTLGALVYADTFVDVPAGEPVILTGALPSLLSFPSTPAEVIAVTRLDNGVKPRLDPADIRPSTASHAHGQDGSRIAGGLDHVGEVKILKAPEEDELLGEMIGNGEEEVTVLTGAAMVPAIKGRLTCFSGGIVLRTRMFPTLVLDFRSHIRGLWLQGSETGDMRSPEEGGTGAPTNALGDVIVLQGKSPSCGMLPVCNLAAGDCIGIALESMRVIARRHMMRVVLPTWEQACREMDIPQHLPSGLPPFPEELRGAHVSEVHWPQKQYMVLQPDSKVFAAFDAINGAEAAQHTGVCSPAAVSLGQGEVSGVGIVLVTGLPGSSQEEVAGALAEFESTNTSWQVIRLPLSSFGKLDVSTVDSLLTTAVNNAQAKATAAASPRVALACECFDSLTSQVSTLAASKACASGAAWLCSVVMCCNSLYLQDPRHTSPPGFLEQLERGLVDSVVISGPQNTDITDMLNLRLPGVPVVQAARGQLLRNLDTLMATTRDREAAAAACMAAWPPVIRDLPSGRLEGVYIKCSGSLDVNAFSLKLQRLGVIDSKNAAAEVPLTEDAVELSQPRLLAVRGIVRTDRGGEIQGLDGLRGHALRLSRWALSASPGSELSTPQLLESDLPGAELLFLGSSLSADECHAMVEASATPPLGCTPLRDVASVTRQERENLEKAHHGLDLPDGYFFDGTTYLDPFGDRLQEHPCMSDFMAAYIKEVNTAIHEKNRTEAEASRQQPLQVDTVRKATVSSAVV